MQDRDVLRRKAYLHYTLAEFKDWAAEQASEMAQQVLRLRTTRCDKEELIKTTLMMEDACAMIWLLLKPDEKMIESIKTFIQYIPINMRNTLDCTCNIFCYSMFAI